MQAASDRSFTNEMKIKNISLEYVFLMFFKE